METRIKIRQTFNNMNRQMLLVENLLPDIYIDKDKEYTMEIKEVHPLRTINQNNYMWVLIKKIAKEELMDDTEVYAIALMKANVKYIYVDAYKETDDELRKIFRAVQTFCPIIKNGKEYIRYKCFLGSSELTKREMKEVINYLKDWAFEIKVITEEEYYSDYYGGKRKCQEF